MLVLLQKAQQVVDLHLVDAPVLVVAHGVGRCRALASHLRGIRQIADEVGALLMFDAAHIAGLIAGGVHPNPVPYSDVVTFTTHKTLRGPRGGCILTRETLANKIDKGIFPGIQ